LLIRTNKVSKINSGNVNENIVIEIKKDFISRLFTSFNINPDSSNDNVFSTVYTWSKKIGPAEKLEIEAKTNYLLPLIIIIALVLAFIGIKRYVQTKLEIIKTAVPVKTSSGQFALKIKLTVKAKHGVDNVSLIDKIPGVVQFYEKFPTIIKPTKIDTKNKRIQWDLGNMNAGEKRFFSYVVYSSLGVVGKFALPSALAVFERNSQIHEVESNVVYFQTESRKV